MSRRQSTHFSLSYAVMSAMVLITTLVVGFTDSYAVTQESLKSGLIEEAPSVEEDSQAEWNVFSFEKRMVGEDDPQHLLVKVYDVRRTIEKLSKDNDVTVDQQRRSFQGELIAWAGLMQVPEPATAMDPKHTQYERSIPHPVKQEDVLNSTEQRRRNEGESSSTPVKEVELDRLSATKPHSDSAPQAANPPTTQQDSIPLIDGVKVVMRESQMIVSATPGVHRRIEKTLEFWSRYGQKQIIYEIHQFECSSEIYHRLASNRGAWIGSSDNDPLNTVSSLDPRDDQLGSIQAYRVTSEPLGVQLFQFNDRQMTELKHELDADKKSRLLSAPRITTFGGQVVMFATGKQRPFVTGFERDENSKTIEPKVTVVHEGTTFAIDGDLIDDEKIKLNFKLEQTTIDAVRTKDAVSGDGSLTKVQIPVTTRTEVQTQAVCDEKSTLLIAGLPTDDEDDPRYIVVAVAPRLIGPAESR